MRLQPTSGARLFGACLLLLCGAGSLCFSAEQFPSRPFVLINKEELAALRQDLAKPGWKADLYRSAGGFPGARRGGGMHANADLWLKRTIQIPEKGGHFHEFYCVAGDQ